MWTEREMYIKDFDEIREYLVSKDNFHDFRVGNLHYADKEATIMIEEDVPNPHASKTVALVWDFSFQNIEQIEIDMDCVLGSWITEINVENNEFVFNCTNGCVAIKAEQAKVGVPAKR